MALQVGDKIAFTGDLESDPPTGTILAVKRFAGEPDDHYQIAWDDGLSNDVWYGFFEIGPYA